jgi:hypothetical protein
VSRGVAAVVLVSSLAAMTAVVSTQQAVRPAATPAPNPLTAPKVDGAGAISGVAIDAQTGAPLAGVVVYLGPPHGSAGQTLRQVSDAKGRFVFTRLAAFENYFILASKPGFFDGHYGRASSGQLGARIAVAEGQWVRDIRVPLSRQSVIEGTVSDERGQPIVGAYVRVLQRILVAGQSRFATGTVATTDDRGAYRLNSLGTGAYLVEVVSVSSAVPSAIAEAPPLPNPGGRGSAPPFAEPLTVVGSGSTLVVAGRYPTPAPSADAGRRVYPSTFYPGATALAGATMIDLQPGETRSAIDFRLVAASAWRVSGRIEAPPTAYAGLPLRLRLAGTAELGSAADIATTLASPDGQFTFADVPPGVYELWASRSTGGYDARIPLAASATLPIMPTFSLSRMSRGSNFVPASVDARFWVDSVDGDDWFGQAAVAVEHSNVSGVALELKHGPVLSGRIVKESSPPVDPRLTLIVPFTAQPANGDPQLGTVAAYVGPAPDEFKMEGFFPGPYVFASNATSKIKSFKCGDRDYAYAAFDGASAGASDCVVTMTGSTTTITGSAHDAGGKADADVGVIIFPAEREQWPLMGLAPQRIKSIQASSNGSFRFQGLPAGEYLAIAVPGDLVNAWQDVRFLEAVAGMSTRFHVDWDGAAALSLETQPVKWPR